MPTLLDILGATFIGGILLALIVSLNLYSSQEKFASNAELHLQQNAKTYAEILNYDLRKIGFGKADSSIVTAELRKISFYTDIDTNGVLDRVTYFLSDSTKVAQTENPRDKLLYRVINNDTVAGPSLGLVDIKFTYKDKNNLTTTILDSIKYVEAGIWLESPERIKIERKNVNEFLSTYWQITINPRNL